MTTAATGLRAERLTLDRMLNSTLTYLDNFARFTQKENVEAVERLLSAHKNLAKFERAQLGTVFPQTQLIYWHIRVLNYDL